MRDEIINKRRVNVKQDNNLIDYENRRISLILPRDDLLIKGKLYKSAYDSMIYNEVNKKFI